uniref:Uncharacterized protein n=1 Tax=Amphimedon queenslandica TaxID=400682 RepID=A0A1X7UL09_AMPQE
MKQFNGQYGCLYCYDEGEIYNRACIYCPDMAHNLRTNKVFEDLAKKADRAGQAQYGIKGKAMLADTIELPQCIPPDYMHSILEGIFKQLMKYWFDSKFHSHPFILRKFMNKINALLLKIKSIKEIQRQPRPLDLISFYKASEYRAWLFYAFPIVAQFLPPEYSHHLSLLVSSLHFFLIISILTISILLTECYVHFISLVGTYTPHQYILPICIRFSIQCHWSGFGTPVVLFYVRL